MAHDFYDREDSLKHCRVCGGAEGSLPTECPGYKMSDDVEAAVYAGTMDYVGGAWVTSKPPTLTAVTSA